MTIAGSDISNFFRDQTVFITGGTGFLGKILLEKLLRTCEVKKIYILVRPKKDKSTKQRFDEFFDSVCFVRLKNEKIDLKSKICFINGNCEKENLGISPESVEKLTKETTIVIHAAAEVKFDRPLKTAANINVRGTRDILNLAKTMPQLKAFVHVSTAYSNCLENDVKEDFYHSPMTPQQLFEILEIDSETLENITSKLLGKWPNTYVFTKSIAEHLVETEGKSLPIAMVRPAIIAPAAEEPIPGWVDNVYGLVGMTIATALGVVRSINAKFNAPAHVIPCDYVANLILAAAWNVSQNPGLIYNYVGSSSNKLTWGGYVHQLKTSGWSCPSIKLLWYYACEIRENVLWHRLHIFLFHTLLGYLIDFILICIGREALAVKNYAKLDKLMNCTRYFTLKDWKFRSDNVEKLWAKMGSKDRRLFKFNMDSMDWASYAKTCILGGRLYLLKDSPETIPAARKKLFLLFTAHYTLVAAFWILIFLLLKRTYYSLV